MKIQDIMPKDVRIDYKAEGEWNCDKCVLFKEEECECHATKRFLLSQVVGDCEDCKFPFVLINQ